MATLRPLKLQALGTHWSIEPLDDEFSAETINVITTAIRDFEQAYSRFRPESYLGVLNDTKKLAQPPAEMVEMVRFGLDMYGRSNGLFNMSVGSKLEQLGYGKQSDVAARISTDLTHDVHISVDEIIVASHVRLDFGGFGKGWLIDKLGALVQSRGHSSYIINGGGDILVRADELTEITIEHPYDSTLGIGSVALTCGSIAGSSGQKRSWTATDGSAAHHIIHPASGQPGGTVAGVHVCSTTADAPALIADTLGTVMLLADAGQRQQFAEYFSVTYLVIGEDLQYYASPGFPGTMYTV